MKMQNKIWYLKKFNIFQNLNQEEMEVINDLVKDTHVKKKSLIFFEGESSENLYFLKEGRVKISRIDESGKEITLTLLEPGELFGELGLFDNSPRQTTATALEDSLICTMLRSDFEKIMENKPELSFKITKLISLKVRKLENKIGELIFKDVPSRLAKLLIRLSEQHSEQRADGLLITIRLTQQELANLIGATREMTSQTLNSFRKSGYISIKSRQITIRNRKELENIAR